jgi:hypothetical protein
MEFSMKWFISVHNYPIIPSLDLNILMSQKYLWKWKSSIVDLGLLDDESFYFQFSIYFGTNNTLLKRAYDVITQNDTYLLPSFSRYINHNTFMRLILIHTPGGGITNVKALKKVFCFHVPVRVDSVARNTRVIEERRQEKVVCFDKEITEGWS